MSNDARLNAGLPGHPKTKKLIRRVGEAGAWHLVCLILWARVNRPDGDLTGMSTEDLELAVDWRGDPDGFVRALSAVGFLDGEEGAYQLHDWAEHQPWATGSEARSEKAKWAALVRRHGRAEAARQMPDYAARLATSSESAATGTSDSAPSNDVALLDSASGRKSAAPSPSPSPSPIPSPKAEEQSSLCSDSSAAAPTDLLGQAEPPADLKARRAARVQQVAEEARAAYNRILARPAGQLAACMVLNKPRLKAVEKALPTARQVCLQLYGSEKIAPQFWEDYFTEASNDDFCAGRGPYRGEHANWRPDFEYLLREEVIARLFDRAASEDAA